MVCISTYRERERERRCVSLNASSLRVWEVKAWRMARRKKWCCIAGCGISRSQQLANNKVQDDTVDNHLLGYTGLFTNSRNQDIRWSFFGFSVMQNFPKPANCWRIVHVETYAKKQILCDITWMWSSNVHKHILYHFFCTRQSCGAKWIERVQAENHFFFPKRHEDSTLSACMGCIIDCPRLT